MPAEPHDPHDVVTELRGDLRRYDPARYPIQHATTAFHLGTALLALGDLDDAIAQLTTAAELFPADALPVEHAKAINMRGIAYRDRGQNTDAAAAFAETARTFAEHGQRLEEAASRYNLGLVLRDLGDPAAAIEAFTSALDTFAEADLRDQSASAARELGTTLLATEQLDEAVDALHRAIDLSRRAGDRAGLGVGTNLLGVVHLAAGDLPRARAAFEDAAGAHPRTIRPEPYAMARANLALACERAGEIAHARLAARQALALAEPSSEVAAQACGILDRLGDDPAAIVAVLDVEDPDRHVGIWRAELGRVADLEDREGHDAAWVRGLAAADDPVPLAEAWLEVVLELPPPAFTSTIAATVRAVGDLDDEVAARVRHTVSRAMARFPLPQWDRLRASFNDQARGAGQEPAWG
jgi:tetratricopeptide (TPR) repeat protein